MPRILVDMLVGSMQLSFTQQGWNPALSSLLDDVDAKSAPWQPATGAHSIWQIVRHLTYNKRVITARLRGESPTWENADNWPTEAISGSQQAWEAVLAELKEAHEALAAEVGALDDAALTTPQGAQGWVPLHALAGLVEHDSWHAGQIAYLKSLRERSFPHQAVGVAAILHHEGKVLLERRALEVGYGLWALPGGMVEPNESPEDALVRELSEETGLQATVGRLLAAKGGRTVCALFYEALPKGGELTCSAESLELAWFGPADIPWDQFAFPKHKEALAEWLRTAKPL